MLSFSRFLFVRFWRCCLSSTGSGCAWGLDTEYINFSTIMQNNVDSARRVLSPCSCATSTIRRASRIIATAILPCTSSHLITPHLISSHHLIPISHTDLIGPLFLSSPPIVSASQPPTNHTPRKKEFEQAEGKIRYLRLLMEFIRMRDGPPGEARRGECKTRIWTRSSNASANVKSCSQLSAQGRKPREGSWRKLEEEERIRNVYNWGLGACGWGWGWGDGEAEGEAEAEGSLSYNHREEGDLQVRGG